MVAINVGSIRWSKAQLRSKQPHVESTGPAASVVPSTFAPSSSTGGMTLEAIMAQLQRMNACLDTFADELCQVNTHVDRIAWQQARFGSFAASPSPSLEASTDEDDNDGDDEDDASSSSDDKMMTSQWLALCHSWQKGGVVLGRMRVVLYLGGELM